MNSHLMLKMYVVYIYSVVFSFPITECERNAGMEAGYILDDKISTSSNLYGYWAGRGRINSEGT